MIPAAIYDWSGVNLMIRCPHCNAWDRGLEGAKQGIYNCEECGQDFLLEAPPA